MHNGSFPHSCVWSILIKSELEESEPPRKPADFHLAVQRRGPSSSHDRRSMASEASVPITRTLFIIFHVCSIPKAHPWKTGKDGGMQSMSRNGLRGGGWGWGGRGHCYMCFALIVFIYWWPSGLRDERLQPILRGGWETASRRNNINSGGNEE